jgi:hypothetical protein
VVELTNREAHAGLRACVVSVRRGRHTLWKDAVGAAATLAAATDAFVAVALATGVLMVRAPERVDQVGSHGRWKGEPPPHSRLPRTHSWLWRLPPASSWCVPQREWTRWALTGGGKALAFEPAPK